MRFSVRLPSGQIRKFAHVEAFQGYVRAWPDSDFVKSWPLPFCCLIEAKNAPF